MLQIVDEIKSKDIIKDIPLNVTYHAKSFTKEARIRRLEMFGYNPIHIIGDLYIVRWKSKNYTKFSFYVPKIFKDKQYDE